MKHQAFLPDDSSTVANFIAWAQGISIALSTLGWTNTADAGQVIWANVVAVPRVPPLAENGWSGPSAWVGGTAYTAGAAAGAGVFSVVTSAGITYWCSTNPVLVLSQVLQNTTNALACTACTATSSGTSVYSCVGATAAMVNMQFVVTLMGANNNNGTFICTAASAGVSITLANGGATAATLQTGTCTSSTAALSFIGTITGGTDNAYVGHSLITSIAGAGNSITATVTSSHTNAFAVTATGTNDTSAGTATENTAPNIDTVHWTPYYYEVWQMTDAASATNPIYMRLTYGTSAASAASFNIMVGTSTTGTGWVTGNQINGGTEVHVNYGSFSGDGAATYECDFCVSVSGGSLSMLLWRAQSTNGFVIIIVDRAKDTNGNDLDAYVTFLLQGNSATIPTSAAQTLFKPSTGTVFPAALYTSNTSATNPVWPALSVYPSLSSLSVNGLLPALPIFPLVGYVGNPLLGAVCFKSGDCFEGGLANAYVYGSIHTFLTTNTGLGTNISNGGIGIRWE